MKLTIEDIKVYLITDENRSHGRDVIEVVSAAVRGGIKCVQYRPPHVSDSFFLDTARRLREITKRADCLLLINDRADIATLCHADGIHIGADDIPIREARLLIGDTGIIGYSAHSPEEANAAARAGADFITYSPVFPTTSSSKPRPPTGIYETVNVECSLPIPVFALGGVSHENAAELLEVGMGHAAVVSAITEADDIEAAARKMCEIFGQ